PEAKVATLSPGYQQKLAGIAEARGLRADILAAWAAHLNVARRDGDDLFYEWAAVAADSETREPQRLAQRLTPFIYSLREKENAAKSALDNATVIIDYSRAHLNAWLPDDSGFGLGPEHPGDVRLFGDAKEPKIRLTERGAAVYDRVWDKLSLAP